MKIKLSLTPEAAAIVKEMFENGELDELGVTGLTERQTDPEDYGASGAAHKRSGSRNIDTFRDCGPGETEREAARNKLLAEMEVGQVRKCYVMDIVGERAIVDLGCVTAVLHLDPVKQKSLSLYETICVDNQLDVRVISVDRENEIIVVEPLGWLE